MADIFSEVEEELRRDKYNALLRRYGLWFLAAAILVIAAAGLHQLVWEPWRTGQIHDASDRYEAAITALAAGQTEQAEAAFAELAEGPRRGYAALALMQMGEIADGRGDRARAAELYNQAADKAGDQALSGFARIRALYAMADAAAYDEILALANPMTGADSPYRASAREIIAAAALRAGDLERARSEYTYLTLAPETPSGIRTRAGEGLAAVDRAESEAATEDAPS